MFFEKLNNMFFEKNFATKEQMERLNKLFYFPGNIIICDYNLTSDSGDQMHSQYAITADAPSEILDKCNKVYQSADLNEILGELPDTICVDYGNGEFKHYYASIKHYNPMISYSTADDTDVLMNFTGKTLIDAAVDAIEWINVKRNGDFYIKIEDVKQ